MVYDHDTHTAIEKKWLHMYPEQKFWRMIASYKQYERFFWYRKQMRGWIMP